MKKVLSLVLVCVMMLSVLALAGCGAKDAKKADGADKQRETLTVAMECAYAPYNWAQADASNGAVPIKDRADYANGYDVMIAKKICEANDWDLEIVSLDWDALIPAVQTGQVDCVIAGQSMTEERMEQVDFAGPYLYASIVCLTKKDGKFANAESIADLAGGTSTSQLGTVWYDTCLPQIEGADIKDAKESAPAMLVALESGDVDFVCTDMPTAQAAVIAYPDLTILNFSGTDGDFDVDDGDINIGISVLKGNTTLLNAINGALEGMTADDFNAIMEDAIKIQPVSQD
ncbi:MAG: transporter substrate-binding domain-containing protein [Clostridia bacterium]|nr:transporter substrate-binding domain-containing protein [Clostridia bacterium]